MWYSDRTFRISWTEALRADDASLKRWYHWAMKNDPSGPRIMSELSESREDMICGLVWVGAISV